MRKSILDAISWKGGHRKISYVSLMQRRVRNILLVSSPYDSFTFEEDGRLTELLFSEYLELNLHYAPNITRVSTAQEALDKLRDNMFDLVISMLRVGEMEIQDFGREVMKLNPTLPVVLLTYDTRELDVLEGLGRLPGIDRVFVWLGDVRLFLAIIKYIEDRLNAEQDAATAGVQSIILVEDNVRFYSSYLPLIYTELVQQTQNLMADGLNRMDMMLRMRARPKILLATNYEEGQSFYNKHRDHVSGVILDAAFQKGGELNREAGIDFARMVRQNSPDCPILVQSSDVENRPRANSLGADFIDKHSPSLLADLRRFMRTYMGFGDFLFYMPDGKKVGSASDLRSLVEMIARVPIESLVYHASRNHFSTWLMARTEFELANGLRSKRVEDFENAEAVRQHLVEELNLHRDRSRAGIVTDFSSGTFRASSGFVRIGSGSLGGKGRGLAFMNKVIEVFRMREEERREHPEVNVFVPPTAVLATGVFDEFIHQADLFDVALSDATDKEIADAFLSQRLPAEAMESLKTFISRVHYPLAVRSSSLLEDASYQPFAGLYRTYMIPNNHEDIDVRLQQLVTAIRLVYASTFFADAKSYIESTPNRLEEEKMAVVIQQVFGRRRGDYLYPDIAGVARSYNFYPLESMKAEEGLASVVLGLGKTVVDGGRTVRFSPAQPHRFYQFSSTRDTLHSAQREFLAMDLSDDAFDIDRLTEDSNLVSLDLDVAEKDGVLPMVGSVYSHENDAIYDGTSRPGMRLVTMAGVLKAGVFPLAKTLAKLLEQGVAGFSSPVEIEFAATIRESSRGKHDFAFLQIRPIVVSGRGQDMVLDAIDEENAICVSHKALGNGAIEGVADLVYVSGKSFERKKTVEIAGEIGSITRKLRDEGRPFVLIGPGRWGSADRWLGIPVTWKQIAGVKCIVETDMEDIQVTPSQGTHFFQNITSFGIGYFTVNFDSVGGMLDMDWLDAEPSLMETEHVRLLRFHSPLEIAVSAKQGIGVIIKPDKKAVKQGD